MKLAAPLLAAACALSLFSVGCGGSDTAGPTAIGDLAAQDVAALCDYQARCGAVTSAAACVAIFSADAQYSIAVIAPLVANGTIKYDAAKARACLDLIHVVPCDNSQRAVRVEPDACAQTFTGTIADGGACLNNLQCVSTSCSQTTCTDACCTGTCRPTRPAPAALGQSCATGSCATDLYCTSGGVCAALLAQGNPCNRDSQCAYGTACTGSPTVCAPVPAEGGACVTLGSGTKGYCGSTGLVCDATNHCARLPVAGAPCNSGTCAADLVCDPANLNCAVRPPIGSPCISEACAAGAFCDFSGAPSGPGVCKATKALGQPCSNADDCQSVFCRKGLCADPAVCAKP